MLSPSTGINFLLSGVLAAVISGIILTINNFWVSSINNKFQLEREKQQRIWQEESDQKKWYREKIYDCYRRAIQVLTQMVQENAEISFYDDMDNSESITLNKRIGLAKLSWEFFAELAIIKAGYPDKDSKEFKDEINKIEVYINNNEFITAQVIITEMIEHDSRITNVSK